ncbi:asparagine synthase (glutamine-hydrolyzing) [Methylomonas rhizoryzae]|uniref:asparagine synthase (glutamine-hydrolyzing) n=1 Tax=Methylomonas rhizoryzae TaxID=2608981 RepID=UPI001232E79F|nr:asparagine synthase (glutamine-hydrolyzing) [Methylomonas rhizoryzae]
MCGISGLWVRSSSLSRVELENIINCMTDALENRGPDGRGVWIDNNNSLALGHRRLAIRDLSELGRQPMLSSCKQLIISYNGEVYNTEEIKRELEAIGRWCKGHSDTEVILEACAEWGVEQTVKKLIGMFAFAVWNIKSRELYLVRDRFGIKPLYMYLNSRVILFGSEVKTFKYYPGFQSEIDIDAVSSFLKHGYVASNCSIYKGAVKVKPGSIIKFNSDFTYKEIIYWDALEEALRQKQSIRYRNASDYIDQMEKLINNAVNITTVSDVPVGAFLSGGIDSSLVVAIMQSSSIKRIRTFSIGFEETSYNEANYAKEIAQYLGTDHTEAYMTSTQGLSIVEELGGVYDEPFADSSQIPTLFLSKLTRQEVTVALSGDGGDEIFAGYDRYFVHNSPLMLPFLNQKLRRIIGNNIKKIDKRTWDVISRSMPSKLKITNLGYKAHRYADRVSANPIETYLKNMMQWQGDYNLLVSKEISNNIDREALYNRHFNNYIEEFQLLDTTDYLPNDILTKVDRASMAVGLEVRVPLLDHRIYSQAWRLPLDLKVDKKQGKLILRKLLNEYVPEHLFQRPKMGFGVPIGQWLRTSLRDWAESLLDQRSIQKNEFLNPDYIQQLWKAHLAGDNHEYLLWNVLMFQAWLSKR